MEPKAGVSVRAGFLVVIKDLLETFIKKVKMMKGWTMPVATVCGWGLTQKVAKHQVSNENRR